jgi:hypothetical protein
MLRSDDDSQNVAPPLVWYEGAPPSEYIAWVYRELVNQGIDVLELPDRFWVLRDLVAWRDTFPNDAFAKSVCWNSFDLEMLVERSRTTKTIAKPRIEVSAEITTKRNLSVRWHPSGFHEAEDDRNRPMHSYNVVDPNAFREPPDFQQFRGDESLSFESRPSNELMFIRGVGFLNPSPDRANATRRDIIDAMLICAVRATHEHLIESLRQCFEVTASQQFQFEFRDEDEEFSKSTGWRSSPRVIGWSLRRS